MQLPVASITTFVALLEPAAEALERGPGHLHPAFAPQHAVLITADNLGEVVNKGVWTWAEICQGIESTEVCKTNM
jgi:hypothetical protein